MSRTKHHRHQHRRKWGLDFGAKYSCNRLYGGGAGAVPKALARSERRSEGKKIIREVVRYE